MTASILVVDDVQGMREILDHSLAGEGHRVATASSGEEALTRLEEQEFDVIVSDIVMPGVGGLEILEKSRVLAERDQEKAEDQRLGSIADRHRRSPPRGLRLS